MVQLIEANWIAFVAALLIGLLVAWWIYARGSKGAKPRERRPDALDEGAAPAQRNQALIDAPAAADLMPPPVSGVMAGIGEVIAVAAQDEVEEKAAREAVVPPPPPVPEPAPAPDATPDGEGDDLRRIKGIGPKLVTLLNALGVTRYAQIAAWTDEDIDRIDAQLGAFAGRPRRDSWVEQAQLLSGGDTSAYEAKFGKL